MRYIFLLFLSFFITLTSYADDIDMSQVQLRAIDKTTGHVKTFIATIGQEYTFSTLTITPEKCLQAPPEDTPENAAFLNISEKSLNTENTTQKQVFSGWMFSSNPALSPMEHPVYDVWVLKCLTPSPEPTIELESPTLSPEINTLDSLSQTPSPTQPDVCIIGEPCGDLTAINTGF